MEIIKRNGTPQTFDARKIRNAIRKANATVSAIEALTDEQMDKITDYVTKACEGYERAVGVEEIQDIVEKQLMAMGAYDVAKNYIIYRKKRERARDTIRIRGAVKNESDITDQSLLLVNSMTQNQVTPWDREKIARRLVNSLGLKHEEASDIAKDVESQIIASNIKYVSSGLIRELVNNALIERGYKGQLQDLTMYKVPRDYVEGLMHTKSTENSNIVMNNPEAVNLAIAELVLKQWALDAVYTPDVKRAHDTGAIHVHDLGYPTRVYAFSGDTAIMVRHDAKVYMTTLKSFWDTLQAEQEPLNNVQFRKDLNGLGYELKDRDKWVAVEQLIWSNEQKPAKHIMTSNGEVQSVTDEHGVVVWRDGHYMLVRADELLETDKLVRCKNGSRKGLC